MFYEGCQTDRNEYKYTPLMLWVMYHEGCPIPDKLKYDGWETDRGRNNNTPLMLHVLCNKGEIPKELKYDGWQRDKNTYYTPLMLWIMNRKGEVGDRRSPQSTPQPKVALSPYGDATMCAIPDELKYPGWRTDKTKYGSTPLMLWVKHRPGEAIPEDMKFDGWETYKNNCG